MTAYKGWEVDVKLGTSPTVLGKAQSMSVEVTSNVDAVHGVGHLDPVELKQGPREISGSIEKMYGDERLWDAINPEGTEQTYLQLEAALDENGSKERIITCSGVKLDTWSLDLPQDDFVSESVDFTATAISLTGSAVSASIMSSDTSTQPASTSTPENDYQEMSINSEEEEDEIEVDE